MRRSINETVFKAKACAKKNNIIGSLLTDLKSSLYGIKTRIVSLLDLANFDTLFGIFKKEANDAKDTFLAEATGVFANEIAEAKALIEIN